MLIHALFLTALSAAAGTRPAAVPATPRFVMPRLAHEGLALTPGVRIWTSHADVYHRGERVRVYYSTERDAFVTVFRIDTDGRVSVIFPRSPSDDNYGYGGATYTVSNFDRGDAFYVDDSPGVGYIFAVASMQPFGYDAIAQGGRWDVRYASEGRIHGDPRASLEDLSAQLMARGSQDYDTHMVPYYVEQHYDYPRFVCYDCHAYTPYTAWDPYDAWCSRYTLVLYNDPYYYYPSYWYPTRYYRGTRVVFGVNTSPRFVFSARASSAPGITYRDRRANDQPGSPGGGRFVRGRDIGGVGSVPAPIGRRTTASAPERRGSGDRPIDRPDGGRPGRDDGTRPGRRDDGDRPGRQGGDRPGRQGGDQPGRKDDGDRGRRDDVTMPPGARRFDNPGIEIVPRPSQPYGEEPARRTTQVEKPSQGVQQRDMPVLRRADETGQDEARPPMPDRRRADTDQPRPFTPGISNRPEQPRWDAPQQSREVRPPESARPAPPRNIEMPRAAPPREAPPARQAPREAPPARQAPREAPQSRPAPREAPPSRPSAPAPRGDGGSRRRP